MNCGPLDLRLENFEDAGTLETTRAENKDDDNMGLFYSLGPSPTAKGEPTNWMNGGACMLDPGSVTNDRNMRLNRLHFTVSYAWVINKLCITYACICY